MMREQSLGKRKMCTRFVSHTIMMRRNRNGLHHVRTFFSWQRMEIREKSLQMMSHGFSHAVSKQTDRAWRRWEQNLLKLKVVVPKILRETNVRFFFTQMALYTKNYFQGAKPLMQHTT